MSTGWSIWCGSCRKERPLGITYASGNSYLGYGTHDHEEHAAIVAFIERHLDHGQLQVDYADNVPDDCEEEA